MMSTNDRPFPIVTVAILGFCLVAAVLLYFLLSHEPDSSTEAVKSISQPLLTPSPTATPSPTKEPEQITAAPLDGQTNAVATPPPLPKLDDSDAALKSDLTALNVLGTLAVKLTPDEIIRKSVRAAYNLSKGNVVQQYRPIEGPAKQFHAAATGETTLIASSDEIGELMATPTYQLSAANFERYTPYVELVNQLEVDSVVRLYRSYYPLLQQAYQELGEGPSEFDQVVMEALDNFLATPEPKQEPILVRTSVLYKYLDPSLERLPNSQKLMLRLGAENRASIKLKLQELKSLLKQTTH